MKLHIGGKQPHPDWKIFDIEERPEVDYVGNASDLSQFKDESIEVIYASHILEHFYYLIDFELAFTLSEWYRVLKRNGKLMISVPDLSVLCSLYSQPNLDANTKFVIMRVIFGGQVNEYDVHKVGFDFDILCLYLEDAGFSECEKVSQFDIFNDCSTLQMLGNYISLNVVATK